MNTDKLVELFKTEVEKLEKEAYERGKRDAMKVDELKNKLKTVKRIAKIGERVLITNAHGNIGYGNDDIGTVIEVVDRTGGGVYVNEWDVYVSSSEYEVIIDEQVQPLSANQQRKELIEQAREFEREHTQPNTMTSKGNEGIIFGCFAVKQEFIVNAEKRTVVCLLKGVESPDVISKGIAKCHPDEVFNADIGKAIALARALEIDVPNEFLNAVQPDEVVVGMVVKTYDFDGSHHATNSVDKVEVIRGKTCLSNRGKGLTGDSLYTSFDKKLGNKIINDTNAEY